MVENVEELRAKLNRMALFDAKVLVEARVKIDQPGAADDSRAGVAKVSGGRLREGVGVKPLVHRLTPLHRADTVRAGGKPLQIDAQTRVNGETALNCGYARV